LTGAGESSDGPDETAEIAARLARSLSAGDVVLLTGEVGAGKSTFVRAALRELGVEGAIPSPTFTIGRLYHGRDGLPLSHLDLYRIASVADEDPGLLSEYLNPGGIAFVEWPGEDRPHLLANASRCVEIAIAHVDRDRRRITVGPLSDPAAPGRGPTD
jgi:tRNA threonylcarbamoyladenosine biosynthesis protein TsaE